jgi:ANTAR domain
MQVGARQARAAATANDGDPRQPAGGGYVQSSELPGTGSLRPAGGPALLRELTELARAVTRDPADPLARSADPVAVSAAIAEAAAQIRQLHTALDSRDVIGQAKGILMERYRLTPDGAFALLARASQNTNVKLREVAAELCRTGTLPGHDDCRQLLAG